MKPGIGQEIELVVNGAPQRVTVPSHWTLLQLLRNGLGMIGTREGCGEGSCGSCTVLVDGELRRSCLFLAARAAGRRVLTIESLSAGGALHPLQTAFVEHGASQCGFCTPGMILAAVALLEETPRPTEDAIKEFMSGNLCRCGGYSMIVRAIQAASGASR